MSNYIAGSQNRIRIPMRDATNALVSGIGATITIVVIRPDGTSDPAVPAGPYAEVAPGVYEVLYTFGAGVGNYTFHASDPGPAVTTVFTETILDNNADTVAKENIQQEFVLASSQITNRNVDRGRVDYEEIKVKSPSASDWSSPIKTYRRYWWYRAMGDYHPSMIGPQTAP